MKTYKEYKTKIYFVLILFFFPTLIFSTNLNLPRDSDGWTIFTPSSDTRIMYVSISGNDDTGAIYYSNSPEVGSDPFKPVSIKPFATYAAAYEHSRDGYPDWILFKRGETFNDTVGTNIRDGRSSTEPFVIAAYGYTGLSPILKRTADEYGLYRLNTGIDWFAVSGINFYNSEKDPDSSDYVSYEGLAGFTQFVGEGESSNGVLVEGCIFRYGGIGFTSVSDIESSLVIRRCVILDEYSSGGHSSGFSSSNLSVLFEESVMDHNGWYTQNNSDGLFDAEEATGFNHNTYFFDTFDTTFQNNIFLRSSSMQNKFTSPSGSVKNVTIDNNLYIDGEIGIGIGTNYDEIANRFTDITISNNVFSDLGRSRPTARGLAWYIQVSGWNGGIVSKNLMISDKHANVVNIKGITVVGINQDVTFYKNIIYNLPYAIGLELDDAEGTDVEDMIFKNNIIDNSEDSGYTIRAEYDPEDYWEFSNNTYYSDKSEDSQFYIDGSAVSLSEWPYDMSLITDRNYPDPDRTILTYQDEIGEESTLDAFIESCRNLDRFDWDTRYTAEIINDWIRDGYFEDDEESSTLHGLRIKN
jgi:hypothetical protein